MTDLDNTQIITADDSLLQNSSTIGTEASLKIISGADSDTYLIGKETSIGRSNPLDIVISAPSLSKQHAKITYNNGQYFITDLGSSNKTFHNKIQLQPNVCYALHNGDEIKLGDIICSFEEQKSTETNKNVVTETNVDVIPSTQTITDSYDDQEPTQPMKTWNENTNNTNRLSRTSLKNGDDDDVAPKQNGLSSSFIPPSSTSLSNDDDSLVIGGTTLPATVPLSIESTQLNNDDQLEIISSTQTKQTIEEDNNTITIERTTTTTATEIADTQAYTLEPPGELISSNKEKFGHLIHGGSQQMSNNTTFVATSEKYPTLIGQEFDLSKGERILIKNGQVVAQNDSGWKLVSMVENHRTNSDDKFVLANLILVRDDRYPLLL